MCLSHEAWGPGKISTEKQELSQVGPCSPGLYMKVNFLNGQLSIFLGPTQPLGSGCIDDLF